jgi:glycosyltransferase involved in cell wall biosynthesis
MTTGICPPVVMQTRWGQPIGYSVTAEGLAVALDALGVPLSYLPTPWEPPARPRHPRLRALASRPIPPEAIQLSYEPANLFLTRTARRRIGFTMLEVDGLPDSFLRGCAAMDEVWVPSRWGAEVFAAAGVTRPIAVMPLGYDPLIFHPAEVPRPVNRRFTFLSVFEWGPRKGADVLLRAYAAAFRADDPVQLVLRINQYDPRINLDREIAALGLPATHPPIAVLRNTQLSDEGLAELYRRADCFVLPTRGEGWGMPILEALACGVPTIATDWSAQTEFFHAGVGMPLRVARLTPADGRSPFHAGHRWAEPDLEHLVTLLRQVVAHPAEAQRLAAGAAAEMRQRWTWQHAAQRVVARLCGKVADHG